MIEGKQTGFYEYYFFIICYFKVILLIASSSLLSGSSLPVSVEKLRAVQLSNTSENSDPLLAILRRFDGLSNQFDEMNKRLSNVESLLRELGEDSYETKSMVEEALQKRNVTEVLAIARNMASIQ